MLASAPLKGTVSHFIGSIRLYADRVLGPQWADDLTVSAEIGDHARRHAMALRRLAQAAASKDRRAARERQSRILRSYSGAVCSILRAAARHGVQLTYAAVQQEAEKSRPNAMLSEPVRVVLVPKRNGKTRPTLAFGFRRDAQKFLVRDVLNVTLHLSSHDYSARGRGVHRAVQELAHQINERQADYLCTADIKDCFGSFSAKGVIDALPLSETIVQNVILLPEDAPIEDVSSSLATGSIQSLRSGLPQGSLLSNLAASAILKPIYDGLADEFDSVGYADDFGAACYGAGDGNAFLEALSSRLAEHPGGELTLREATVDPIGSCPTFLGYQFMSDDGVTVRLQPSEERIDEFFDRLRDELPYVGPPGIESYALQRAGVWAKAWAAWDHMEGVPKEEFSPLEWKAIYMSQDEADRRRNSGP